MPHEEIVQLFQLLHIGGLIGAVFEADLVVCHLEDHIAITPSEFCREPALRWVAEVEILCSCREVIPVVDVRHAAVLCEPVSVALFG